ncbi:MAG: glycosyltransferase family 2 protein [Lysobacterales bacterium]|nr:MAG: glycosyltransferase family 2 protein [Xanthomonadales bacterium]
MISVVIPVFNTAPYLERVVAALLAQDYPRGGYELIFVDNGSNDGSPDTLARYPEIRLLREPERGSYAARNLGLRHARGDILAFTDSDCFPAPGWLTAIDRAFRAGSAQVLLGPRLPVAGSRAARLLADYDNHRAEFICAAGDPDIMYGYTNNMAVRRAAMDRFGPFERRMRGADTLFLRRVVAGLSCAAVAYCPDMIVRHAELESVAGYYRKAQIYSRSHAAFRPAETVRPLSLPQRLRVLRVAARGHLRFGDTLCLAALLIGGVFAWWLGGRGSRTDPSGS